MDQYWVVHREISRTGTSHSSKNRDRCQAHMAPRAPALEREAVSTTPTQALKFTKKLLKAAARRMRLAPMRAWEKGAIPSRAQDGQNGRTVGLVGARQGHRRWRSGKVS